jgi:deoxyribose-phosphate aldolase
MNQYIDHTFLKPNGSIKEIDQVVSEAIKYQFKSVCIQPRYVSYVHNKLKSTDVLTCTVIGFPLGENTTATKIYETKDALKNGADEIDMVAHIPSLLSHDFKTFKVEVSAIKEVCGPKVLKVILETAYLDLDTIKKATLHAIEAGADFVKTSTGFGPGGATLEAVKAMKEMAKDKGVKASGGVRNLEDAQNFIKAGATRIGTSNGVAIVSGQTAKENY